MPPVFRKNWVRGHPKGLEVLPDRGLAGVVHAYDLLAFSQALEVPVGGGDPDGRAFAGGPLMNLEGSEGAPGGPDDLQDDFPLPGRSLHSG